MRPAMAAQAASSTEDPRGRTSSAAGLSCRALAAALLPAWEGSCSTGELASSRHGGSTAPGETGESAAARGPAYDGRTGGSLAAAWGLRKEADTAHAFRPWPPSRSNLRQGLLLLVQAAESTHLASAQHPAAHDTWLQLASAGPAACQSAHPSCAAGPAGEAGGETGRHGLWGQSRAAQSGKPCKSQADNSATQW